MPTEEQLKLALAKAFPDIVTITYSTIFTWKKYSQWITDREWLQVCWECEETLPETKRGYYNAELSLLASKRNLSCAVKEPQWIFDNHHATFPQRATTLLKVKGIKI